MAKVRGGRVGVGEGPPLQTQGDLHCPLSVPSTSAGTMENLAHCQCLMARGGPLGVLFCTFEVIFKKKPLDICYYLLSSSEIELHCLYSSISVKVRAVK